MVGGDHEELVAFGGDLWQEITKPVVELLQAVRVACGVAAVPELHVEIDRAVLGERRVWGGDEPGDMVEVRHR